MHSNEQMPAAKGSFLQFLTEELSEAVENDPKALREALIEEGLDPDKLVRDGLALVQRLQEKPQSRANLLQLKPKAQPQNRFEIFSLFRLPKYAYALAAVLVVGVVLWLFTERAGQKQFFAKRGEQFEMLLPDGSKVKLNSGSSLAVERNFNSDHRTVTLSGEAFFDVRKSDLPFIVNTDGARIRVVGTQFNVKSRRERIEVAVSEGIVAVSSNVAADTAAVQLRRGQFTVFSKGAPPAPPKDTNTEYPAWMQGKLAFYSEDLQNIFGELERRFNVAIQLGDPSLAKTVVTCQFSQSDGLKTILSAICQMLNKNYRQENEKFIIY